MSYPPPEDYEPPLLGWLVIFICIYLGGIAALFLLRRFLETL